MRNVIILSLISFLIFLIAACYITYPLLFHLGDYATGLGDELLLAWIQSWVVHALFTNPLNLFNANIYYPYPNSLAYSDLFLGSSLLTYPFVLLTGQPIAANNSLYIFSLLFLGFSIFLLAYYLTRDFFASLLAGILVVFSPATLGNYVGLQILSIAGVPLSILFFLVFLDTKKTKYLLISLLFFLLQTYNSFLPGYFILFSFIIILLYRFSKKKKNLLLLLTKRNIVSVLITFVLLIPVVIPYYQVSSEFHYVRDIRDTIHFALQPEDLLYSSNSSRLAVFLNTLPINKHSQNSEYKPGYLGIVFSLLTLFVLCFLLIKRKKIGINEKIFLTIALVGIILSLGPFLHLGRQTIHHPFPVPLPYLLFYYVLPGFNGIRNSARWEMLFIVAMPITISLVISQTFKKIKVPVKIFLYVLLFLGIFSEFTHNIPYVKVQQTSNFPQIYSWMNTTPQNAVFIQMPIYTWNMQPYVYVENLREYESTVEFRRMVNGASGYSPQPWQNLVISLMSEFPSQQSIKTLDSIGTNYIIVHKNEYDTLNRAHVAINKTKMQSGSTIIEELLHNKHVHLVKQIGNDYVFKIS